MEVSKDESQSVILEENSTVHLYLCDSFYGVAFTDPSILFDIARGVSVNCLRGEISLNISKLDRRKSPCIIDVKRVPGQ